MRITEILRTIKDQVFVILQGRKCSETLLFIMLRTYFVISRQLDIIHSANLIKLLELILLFLTMSILTSSAYKYISLALLLICFSLIIYIIIAEFLKLKSLYSDIKIACSFQEGCASSGSSNSS